MSGKFHSFFSFLPAKNNFFNPSLNIILDIDFVNYRFSKTIRTGLVQSRMYTGIYNKIMNMIMFKIGGTMIIFCDHFRQIHKLFSSCPPFRDLHNIMIMIVVRLIA